MHKYHSINLIKKEENITVVKHIAHDVEKEHAHDFIELEYICCGSGRQVVNGVTYCVERGDLIFLNFGDTHSYDTDKEIGIIDCIINPEFFGNELICSQNAMEILALSSFMEFAKTVYKISPKTKFVGKDLVEIDAIMEAMLNEFNHKSIGYMTILKGYMDVLLIKIFRAFQKDDFLNVYSHMKRVTPDILQYIENNYNKKITLNQLAKESFYNPTYFSKIFKECYNKTFTEYINEKRINHAMRLLAETDDSIEKICCLVGYNDKKQFYKHFKAIAGLTPKKYRDNITR